MNLEKPTSPQSQGGQTANPGSGSKDSPADQPDTQSAHRGLPGGEPPPERPSKWPHYSVQSTLYSLPLSALAMAHDYEQLPGAEERQKKLARLVAEYEVTCEQIRARPQ